MYIMDVHNGGINGCYHLVCVANASFSGLLLSLLMLSLFRGIYKIITIIILKGPIFILPKMFMNSDFELCLFRLWGLIKLHSLLTCKYISDCYNF